MMQTFIAKYRFNDGAIKRFTAIKAVLTSGWMIQMDMKDGSKQIVETARGEQKIYLKLDSLVNDVERITGRVSSLNLVI